MKVGGEFISLYGAYTHSTSRIVRHSFTVVLLAVQCRLHNENYKYGRRSLDLVTG